MVSCWLFSYIIRPTDDRVTVFNKKLLLVGSIAVLVAFVSTLESPGDKPISGWLCSFSGIAAGLIYLIQIIIERKLRESLLECLIYMVTAALLFGDLSRAVYPIRGEVWYFSILLVDVCIVCKLPCRVAKNVIAANIAWLCVAGVEGALRLGFYDIPLLFISQEQRREPITCNDIPCKVSAASAVIFVGQGTTLLLLDYYFTTRFAHDVQREHQKMNEAIHATENIATSLSRFDLEAAEAIILTSSLPPPLFSAFHRIISNLHSYRPYLPRSCLYEDSMGSCSETESLEKSVEINDKLTSKSNSVEMLSRLLEKRRCSFVVTNMLDTHKEVAEDVAAYQKKYSRVLERSLYYYTSVSGVVSVIIGDHIHVSFNAVKRCAVHAKNAVIGATELNKNLCASLIHVASGVSSGTAYCGSLGCFELRSVSTIGPSAASASALQGVARAKDCGIVCSGATNNEISYDFTTRIILGTVRYLSDPNAKELAYEVLTCPEVLKSNETEEWMYQLEERPWEPYNAAAKQFLLGDRDEALRLLKIDRPESSIADAAEAELASMIKCGAKPAVYGAVYC